MCWICGKKKSFALRVVLSPFETTVPGLYLRYALLFGSMSTGT
jgi:hypothetical protein